MSESEWRRGDGGRREGRRRIEAIARDVEQVGVAM